MATVYVVVREDSNTDTTTVERVFENGVFTNGYRNALSYVRERDVYPGVEFFIEEMPLY